MSPQTDPNATDIRVELSTFGFSDTEIDAYLAILANDEATTRSISEAADVTQRAVYNIAERLEDRGLVRVKEHASPTTITAVPPEEAIDNLTERLDSIRPQLEETYTQTTPESPDIQIIKARETALSRLRDAIERAEAEIAIVVPEPIYPEIAPELQVAKEQGLFVLLILGDYEERTDGKYDFTATADVVRHWDEHLQFLYVADDSEAMIGEPTVLSGSNVDEHAVYVSEGNLAGAIFSIFVGAYWPACSELFVTDPEPLPQSFGWFRDAVVQATLHHRNDVDLHAAVETASGERISGRVTDIHQQFVEPAQTPFSLQNTIFVDTGSETVSIGGPGSFLEDEEATSIRLSVED
ncbi:MAG: TrmB family transcriptional regulator [Halorhabdus sp.]